VTKQNDLERLSRNEKKDVMKEIVSVLTVEKEIEVLSIIVALVSLVQDRQNT
jgi:hypothetical protein